MNTVPITRSVEPVAPLGRLLCAVGVARASLKSLTGWTRREEPAAAAPMTRAQEAYATREYAVKFFETDPRFAAELCAAADRHERGENA